MILIFPAFLRPRLKGIYFSYAWHSLDKTRSKPNPTCIRIFSRQAKVNSRKIEICYVFINYSSPDTFKLFSYLSVKSKPKELGGHKAVPVRNKCTAYYCLQYILLNITNKYKRNFQRKLYCSFREECKQSFSWAALRTCTYIPSAETKEHFFWEFLLYSFLDLKQREQSTEIY